MEGVNTKRYMLLEKGLLMMDGSGLSSWGLVKC